MTNGYRPLPGRLRGFFRGASLWMGDDHILSVRSLRFREEYKRFYLRDIQAILVAEAPRFLVSTVHGLIVLSWLLLHLVVRFRFPASSWITWLAGVLLVAVWLYLSAARSCTCRIHTAVSRDRLPSLYRRAAAAKFLAEVEPRIRMLQGDLDPGWAELVEHRPVMASPAALPSGEGAPAAGAARRYTVGSLLFIAALALDAAQSLYTLHSTSRFAQWSANGLALVEIGAAVLIFVDHHRGTLRAGMQRLAIAALLAMGGVFYVRQVLLGTAIGTQQIADPAALTQLPGYLILRQVDAGLCVALALAGLVITALPAPDKPV